MGRFDTAFSLAVLVLIGVSVVCLCKTAEYRSQAKFATERYEEMKDSLMKAEREAERKLRETDAEWKAKIWKTEREAELAEKEQNRKHRLEIEKTRTEHAAEIAGRDEQIRALEERIVKLSNDAVRVIARYRAQNHARQAVPPHIGTQTVRMSSAGKVVDRSCDSCGGKGKISRKETCAACRGQGLFIRTSPGGITWIRNVYGHSYAGEPRYTTVKDKCQVCGGKGWVRKSIDCARCNGVGRVPLKK